MLSHFKPFAGGQIVQHAGVKQPGSKLAEEVEEPDTVLLHTIPSEQCE